MVYCYGITKLVLLLMALVVETREQWNAHVVGTLLLTPRPKHNP